jgi:hypothetical protein
MKLQNISIQSKQTCINIKCGKGEKTKSGTKFLLVGPAYVISTQVKCFMWYLYEFFYKYDFVSEQF